MRKINRQTLETIFFAFFHVNFSFYMLINLRLTHFKTFGQYMEKIFSEKRNAYLENIKLCILKQI